jgi:hypothetical protein
MCWDIVEKRGVCPYGTLWQHCLAGGRALATSFSPAPSSALFATDTSKESLVWASVGSTAAE